MNDCAFALQDWVAFVKNKRLGSSFVPACKIRIEKRQEMADGFEGIKCKYRPNAVHTNQYDSNNEKIGGVLWKHSIWRIQ